MTQKIKILDNIEYQIDLAATQAPKRTIDQAFLMEMGSYLKTELHRHFAGINCNETVLELTGKPSNWKVKIKKCCLSEQLRVRWKIFTFKNKLRKQEKFSIR